MTFISVDKGPCFPQSEHAVAILEASKASPAFLPLLVASWPTTHQSLSTASPLATATWPAPCHFHCPSFSLASFHFPQAASECYFPQCLERVYYYHLVVIFRQVRLLLGSPHTFTWWARA